MKIEPFKIEVTREQNRIVQKMLFKNEYTWASGQNHDTVIDDYVDYSFLVFKHEEYSNKNCLYWANDFRNLDHIPLITFDQFIKKYGISGERREKLKKISNENH